MQPRFLSHNQRGITVLALLLLIIAVVIVGFFVVRYLATGEGPEVEVSSLAA